MKTTWFNLLGHYHATNFLLWLVYGVSGLSFKHLQIFRSLLKSIENLIRREWVLQCFGCRKAAGGRAWKSSAAVAQKGNGGWLCGPLSFSWATLLLLWSRFSPGLKTLGTQNCIDTTRSICVSSQNASWTQCNQLLNQTGSVIEKHSGPK